MKQKKLEYFVGGKVYKLTLEPGRDHLTCQERECMALVCSLLDPPNLTLTKAAKKLGITRSSAGRRIHKILPRMSKSLYNRVKKQLYLNRPENLRGMGRTKNG